MSDSVAGRGLVPRVCNSTCGESVRFIERLGRRSRVRERERRESLIFPGVFSGVKALPGVMALGGGTGEMKGEL